MRCIRALDFCQKMPILPKLLRRMGWRLLDRAAHIRAMGDKVEAKITAAAPAYHWYRGHRGC